MEPLDTTCLLMDDDDLLNFSLEDEDYVDEKTKNPLSSSSNPHTQDPDDPSRSFPGFVEEELEWILNKDAFPAVETCLGIGSSFSAHENDQSPVSVLENSNGSTIMRNCGTLLVPVSFPVRARSKRIIKRRRVFPELPTEYPKPSATVTTGAAIGRRCQHCQAEKTPQWRAGPMGPKTLCNACGVRYKSGRLVPEYRPASSPTFSSELHSNSHRKIIEMRRQNQVGEIPVEEASKSRRLGLSSFILDSIL